MEELKTKIMTWIGNNMVLAMVLGAVVALFVLKKVMKRTPRRRRRYSAPVKRYTRRTRRRYNKSVPGKKPWQIKGSLAAKRRMAQIRRKR